MPVRRPAGRSCLLVPLCLALAACATGIPKDALRLQESSVEIRSIQSRTLEAPSEAKILAATVAVLQDMEYNLDTVEKPLGVLTASKVADADSKSEKAGLLMMDILCAAGGSGGCNYSATASDQQKITVTMVVLPSLARKGEFVTRITIQRAVIDKQGRVKMLESLVDPAAYQKIFDNLSKAIFLQVNE